MLEVKELSVRLGDKDILRDISFALREGDWLMLAGPNGAGKSTLLGALAQSIPYSGQALFEGRALKGMKPRKRAACLGLLSQKNQVGYAFTGREVISMGRYAHSDFLSSDRGQGERAVDAAAGQLGLQGLMEQSVLTLSGGELQRVFLAQLLAQNPRIMLLDEPANHLDLQYQQQVFRLMDAWRRQPGRAVISVVHDLSLARKYGDRVLLLHEGRVLHQGPARDTLSRENLHRAYHMNVPAWMREMLEVWEEER